MKWTGDRMMSETGRWTSYPAATTFDLRSASVTKPTKSFLEDFTNMEPHLCRAMTEAASRIETPDRQETRSCL